MAQFAFTQANLPFEILYFACTIIIAFGWWILWKTRIVNTSSSNGKRKYTSFWRWWFCDINLFSRFGNIFVFVVLLYNIFRLICTLIFGFAPTE